MYSFFYPDAKRLLKEAGGEIIINDGRNYVYLTNKKYDIVTIDPPPPFNAAGTTVLYSEGFYQDMLHMLKSDSIVMQWIPLAPRTEDNLMVTKSFINVFPYVIGIKSPGHENGLFVLGSLSPIIIDRVRLNEVFSSKVVSEDLAKFNLRINTGSILPLTISRSTLDELTQNVSLVTDNHPRTEYFFLRYLLTKE